MTPGSGGRAPRASAPWTSLSRRSPRPAGLEALVVRTSKGASLLGGVATFAITALITFDVLMRFFFGEPQLFVDELASFLQVVVIFWGLAYTFRVGGPVRVARV